MRLALVVLLLALAACPKPQAPPALPEAPAAPAPAEAPPALTVTTPEVTILPVPPSPPAQAPLPDPGPLPRPHGKGARSPAEPTPEKLIQDAQRAARVAPTREGYWGNSGTQRYLWVPGKIYDIYLSPGNGTKVMLPPGETLAHALILNPKSFDITMATIGNEITATSVVIIRPCAPEEDKCVPSPPVDVAVTSSAGRSYNLHLMIGKVGMVEVQWELIPIPLLQLEEPGMLPRHQP